MCPSAPRVCSEPGGQKPVLSLSLDRIRPLGTKFSDIRIKIQKFSVNKMHVKTSSVKWRPFCPGRGRRSAAHRFLCHWVIFLKEYDAWCALICQDVRVNIARSSVTWVVFHNVLPKRPAIPCFNFQQILVFIGRKINDVSGKQMFW